MRWHQAIDVISEIYCIRSISCCIDAMYSNIGLHYDCIWNRQQHIADAIDVPVW